jgi:uncharacterized membrane protein YqgA involved in biofilm formation
VGEWRYSSTVRDLSTRELATSVHWFGGFVILGAGLNVVEKRKIS